MGTTPEKRITAPSSAPTPGADLEGQGQTGWTPPFPVEPGHTIQYLDGRGFQAGYFVRWTTRGNRKAVIRTPSGQEKMVPVNLTRPSNDARTVRLRGGKRVHWTPPEDARTPTRLTAPRRKGRR